jgi:hypothetical protein
MAIFLIVIRAEASESDLLFILIKANPLSGFSNDDGSQNSDKTNGKQILKKPFMKIENFHQAEISQTTVLQQHTLKGLIQNESNSASPFATISFMTSYEPQNPYDKLRIKNNDAINRTNVYGFTTGLQHSEGDRWWALALGFNQIRKRDNQTLTLIEKRQSITTQYAVFDRSFYPYLISCFVGVDAGIGGLYSRLTVYIPEQNGWLLGPDLHFYRDTNIRRVKLGGAIAGLYYQHYEAQISAGYEEDNYRHQGGYFSFGLIRHF